MNETSMDISIMDFESAAADDADDNEKNSYQVISSEQIVDTLKSAIEDITGVFDVSIFFAGQQVKIVCYNWLRGIE